VPHDDDDDDDIFIGAVVEFGDDQNTKQREGLYK
jgi:hypothetical protein